MPPHRIEDARFEQVETDSPDQLVIYGIYTILTDIRSEMVDASRQRVTFLYRRQDNGFRLYHLHVSHEWTELTGDEFFPVQVSRETYHYVQKLLSESGRSLRRRIAIEAEGASHYRYRYGALRGDHRQNLFPEYDRPERCGASAAQTA